MIKFPVVIVDKKNENILKHVFPSMQNYVDKIINEFDDPIVKRIILFGSSITYKCKESSDLDIAVETFSTLSFKEFLNVNLNLHEICKDIDMDIINYNAITNNRLKDEIDKKGVVIYERS